MDTSRKITRLRVTTTHTIKPPMPTLLHNVSWQLSTSCCVKVVFEAQRSLLAVFFQNVLMMGAKIILFLRTHKLFTIILRTHSSDIDFPHICLPTLCTCPSVLCHSPFTLVLCYLILSPYGSEEINFSMYFQSGIYPSLEYL